MNHNVFQFGDTYWKQQDGTAMGAPPAPTYANIAFALHEIIFLPKYKDFFIYYKRYIDDMFIIWNPNGPYNHQNLQEDLSFGILRWEVNKPSKSVNFLDITIILDQQNKVITKKTTPSSGVWSPGPPLRKVHSKRNTALTGIL